MNVNNKPRNRREDNKNTKPNQHTPGRGPKVAESSGQSWKNLCSEARPCDGEAGRTRH